MRVTIVQDEPKKLECLRCHDPLDHGERIFCLHCQFVVDNELKDAEGCAVCGNTDEPVNGWECPGCGSV